MCQSQKVYCAIKTIMFIVDVENAIKTTVDQFGRIDFAFNNAGIEGERACIHEYPEKVFDQVMNVSGIILL